MNNPVEILVHISAPSASADDARYRQQAIGFLSFTHATRHNVTLAGNRESLLGSSKADEEVRIGHEGNLYPARDNVQSSAHSRARAFLNDTRTGSPVIHIARTPAVQVYRTPASFAAFLKRPRTAFAAVPDTPIADKPIVGTHRRSKSDSWETPPLVIPDSQPSNASLKRAFVEAMGSSRSEEVSSPTIKRHHVMHHNSSEEQQKRLNTKSEHGSQVSTASLSSMTHGQGSSEVDKAVSELRSSQIPTELPPSSIPRGTEEGQTHTRSKQLPDIIIPSSLSSSQSLPLRSSQTTSSQSLPPEAPALPDSPFPTSSISIPPSSEKETFDTERFTKTWTQIRAPPPPTGDEEFTTHMTASLRTIVGKAPPDKYFKPASQTRALQVMERGFWRFNIPPDWRGELRRKFWGFLESIVGSGKAGWGTRVERLVIRERLTEISKKTSDTECDEHGDKEEPVVDGDTYEPDNSFQDKSETKEQRSGEMGQKSKCTSLGGEVAMEEVTAYCWGEVAAEIWLVLWMASNRKIKGLGSVWIDAGGETVITME